MTVKETKHVVTKKEYWCTFCCYHVTDIEGFGHSLIGLKFAGDELVVIPIEEAEDHICTHCLRFLNKLPLESLSAYSVKG